MPVLLGALLPCSGSTNTHDQCIPDAYGALCLVLRCTAPLDVSKSHTIVAKNIGMKIVNDVFMDLHSGYVAAYLQFHVFTQARYIPRYVALYTK